MTTLLTDSSRNGGQPSPPPHFNDPHAFTRSQIDQQISQLRQQLRNLQRARNSLLPVSSLPNEVLSHVFSLCRSTGTRNLLVSTWVCHHWRDVALSNAPLWAYVGPDNYRCVRECLARSKQASLEGYVIVDQNTASMVKPHLSSEMYRFRSLQIRVSHASRHIVSDLGAFFTRPAPWLETLYLAYIPITTPLFSGISPLLQNVELHRCRITSWTSNTLPLYPLKRLSLQLGGPLSQRISVQSFIQSLPHSLPNMESLTLDNALRPSPIPTTPTPIQLPVRTYFPNLKKLRFSSHSASPIVELLELCDIVPSTRVRIHISANERHEPQTVLGILQVFQASEVFRQRNVISAALRHKYDTEDSILVKTIPGPENTNDRSFEFYFVHQLAWADITQLFINFTVHTLKLLTLAAPEILLGDWTRVFASFTALEQLVLQDELSVRSFIQFIIISTPEATAAGDSDTSSAQNPNAEPQKELPFPLLRTLTFRDYHLDSDVDPDVHEEFHTFCSALGVRRDRGLGLDKMVVSKGVFYVELLREVVDDVSVL